MPFDATPIPPPPEVKEQRPSFTGFLRWLERQPSDGTYCYVDLTFCPIAQYFSDNGINPLGGFRVALFELLIGSPIVAKQPHTYGAALVRAKAILDPKRQIAFT